VAMIARRDEGRTDGGARDPKRERERLGWLEIAVARVEPLTIMSLLLPAVLPTKIQMLTIIYLLAADAYASEPCSMPSV
jgi:hypothetical protein